MHFPKLSHIYVGTLDELTVLQALHAETNWAVVTNRCCCRSIGVKYSTKCQVGSDCCQIELAKFVIGYLTLTSVSNVHMADFP